MKTFQTIISLKKQIDRKLGNEKNLSLFFKKILASKNGMQKTYIFMLEFNKNLLKKNFARRKLSIL